jgi:hypothetical protein
MDGRATTTLMMEVEDISETLVFNATLALLIARELFHYKHKVS